ncbi:hypothetical protein K2X33_14430, partial [bacterium]|nr:hypothetical protein [bacterium]
PVFSREGDGSFQLPTFFWDAVEHDPAMAQEFERRVELRARQILENESSEMWKSLKAAAHQEGVALGLEEGKVQLEALVQTLEATRAVLAQERGELLHQHEKELCALLKHLVDRFLQPISTERLNGLQAWVEESMGAATNQTTVQVALSPKVHAEVEGHPSLKVTGWAWVADPSLKDGDLRVELEGGGLSFSTEEQVGRLQQKLDEILGTRKA